MFILENRFTSNTLCFHPKKQEKEMKIKPNTRGREEITVISAKINKSKIRILKSIN